jgi:sugar (pentulose or hexulose) kinase
VLGIDLGTQSLKVLFYDYDARTVRAQAASPLEVDRDHTGRAEQQADWWLAALQSALRQVPEDVRNSVQAIGVSGQQHGFVPVDAGDRVVAPVKLWCDTATWREADEITAVRRAIVPLRRPERVPKQRRDAEPLSERAREPNSGEDLLLAADLRRPVT